MTIALKMQITTQIATLEDVFSVLSDDDVMHRTCGGFTLKQLSDALSSLWPIKIVGAYIGGKCVAVYGILESGLMHFAVLPSYRMYAASILLECRKIMPESVVCEIPKKYKEVIMFARKNGFTVCGESEEKIKLKAGDLCLS